MLISHQPRANRQGMGIAVRFDHNRGVLFAIGNLKSEQREISKLEESVLVWRTHWRYNLRSIVLPLRSRFELARQPTRKKIK